MEHFCIFLLQQLSIALINLLYATCTTPNSTQTKSSTSWWTWWSWSSPKGQGGRCLQSATSAESHGAKSKGANGLKQTHKILISENILTDKSANIFSRHEYWCFHCKGLFFRSSFFQHSFCSQCQWWSHMANQISDQLENHCLMHK